MGVVSVRWDAFNADPNPPCVVLYFIIKKFRSILDIVNFFDKYLCIKSERGKVPIFQSQLLKTCAFYLINVNY
jgi:hypothetical protein